MNNETLESLARELIGVEEERMRLRDRLIGAMKEAGVTTMVLDDGVRLTRYDMTRPEGIRISRPQVYPHIEE